MYSCTHRHTHTHTLKVIEIFLIFFWMFKHQSWETFDRKYQNRFLIFYFLSFHWEIHRFTEAAVLVPFLHILSASVDPGHLCLEGTGSSCLTYLPKPTNVPMRQHCLWLFHRWPIYEMSVLFFHSFRMERFLCQTQSRTKTRGVTWPLPTMWSPRLPLRMCKE